MDDQTSDNVVIPPTRSIEIWRSQRFNFGFIASSERPVVIQFVSPGWHIDYVVVSFLLKFCVFGLFCHKNDYFVSETSSISRAFLLINNELLNR